MKVTLTANCGILAEAGGVKFMYDALHVKKTEKFSRVGQSLLAEIINGAGDYSRVDYMLVSHGHIDHYDRESVAAFMKSHPKTRVLSPFEHAGNADRLEKVVEQFDFGEVKIKAGRLMHDGERYREVINYGFIVDIKGETMLFLGDAAMDGEAIGAFVADARIDTAFLNFPYVSLMRGKKIVSEVIKPKKTVVFHLPFPGDDNDGFVERTKYIVERDKDKMPPAFLLYKEGQVLEL